MSTNSELARLFTEMAAALELSGANPFRVRAQEKVARILEDLTEDVAPLAGDLASLTAIDGIGAGSAKKIQEFVTTGAIAEHETLWSSIPRGLLDVLKVPGLGPKTVKTLWEHGGVTDLASLSEKLASGELEALPRMGARTLQNIRDSVSFMSRSGDRKRLGEALPLAEAIVERLARIDGVRRIEFAGSLRRGRETIGDIDVLVAADDPSAVTAVFTGLPGIEKVLVSGETKSSIRLELGMQVDLRLVDEGAFGAALLYFTGSKEHNVQLRDLAIRQGMRLNEYGLFPDDDEAEPPQHRGVEPVAAASEEEIYEALGVAFVPPELREAHGELDRSIPTLVSVPDVVAELHAHTVASDGLLTIEELAEEATRRGYHTLAVTDHSRSSAQANGLSPERLREHIDEVRSVDGRVKDIRLLAGSEVDIHADGSLDYDDDLLAALDVVVASPHASLRQDAEKATARLLAAVRHPLVHVLGHPTGRIINSREGMHPDIPALVAAAAESDTALEVNANFMRLDLRDAHVRAAVAGGALVAINTDAHSVAHFDFLRYGVLTARRGWLTPDRCVNAWPADRLLEWIRSKRPDPPVVSGGGAEPRRRSTTKRSTNGRGGSSSGRSRRSSS